LRDWREGVVFSRLGYGGNRSPEPFGLELMALSKIEGLVEGNAEGAIPCKQAAEKTRP